MAKLSGVDIHDFGTTFKAYRSDIIHQIPLYGEMHRFIPALASWLGASICEIPIKNVNRERGTSHYGISRTFRVLFDLITIRFLLKYLSRPLHFFGTLGAVGIMVGSGIATWPAVVIAIKAVEDLFSAAHALDLSGVHDPADQHHYEEYRHRQHQIRAHGRLLTSM